MRIIPESLACDYDAGAVRNEEAEVRIEVSGQAAAEYAGDALVVPVMEGEGGLLPPVTAQIDQLLEGLIGRLVGAGEIRGKPSEVTVLHTAGRLPAARVAVVGLGKGDELELIGLRRAMGAAARFLRDRGCSRIGATLHSVNPASAKSEDAVRAVIEGACVGLYTGGECRTQRDLPEEIEQLSLVGLADDRDKLVTAARVAEVAGRATNYARRLVNLPGNEVTPVRLAEEAAQLASQSGLEVELLEPAQIEALGMGAFMAVAAGSEQPPRLIVLRHQGAEGGPTLALIGKGITFDSGGISIKPSDRMHLMKEDMAGAAAVLAAIGAAARLELRLNLLGIIPAAENLPSGKAYKPGDVVKALSGKTIEIITTDAEGRLLLADALSYARQLGATHLVDVATLTGACVVALGHVAAGVMGNDSALVEAVLDAGERAGERMWRLPLFPEYRSQLDSKVADLMNVGGRPAGTITAGWFLREFVGGASWAHIDIAGTAWNEKDQPHQVEGATGAGTRTLIALAEQMAGGIT